MALTLKDIALALARANGHTDPEAYAYEVATAHEAKDAYVHPSKAEVPAEQPQ